MNKWDDLGWNLPPLFLVQHPHIPATRPFLREKVAAKQPPPKAGNVFVRFRLWRWRFQYLLGDSENVVERRWASEEDAIQNPLLILFLRNMMMGKQMDCNDWALKLVTWFQYIYIYLEPQTTIYKWLFQLDDSKPLHRKWLEITKHPFLTGCLGYQV